MKTAERGRSSTAEHQIPILGTRVRLPSPAPSSPEPFDPQAEVRRLQELGLDREEAWSVVAKILARALPVNDPSTMVPTSEALADRPDEPTGGRYFWLGAMAEQAEAPAEQAAPPQEGGAAELMRIVCDDLRKFTEENEAQAKQIESATANLLETWRTEITSVRKAVADRIGEHIPLDPYTFERISAGRTDQPLAIPTLERIAAALELLQAVGFTGTPSDRIALVRETIRSRRRAERYAGRLQRAIDLLARYRRGVDLSERTSLRALCDLEREARDFLAEMQTPEPSDG